MLAINLKHMGKPSIFPRLFFSPTSYYFRSWKTFWDMKDVYKMKKEVERRFLCFSGFGWKFRLACSFYGHKGISMSLYLSEFGRNSPRCNTFLGREDRKASWLSPFHDRDEMTLSLLPSESNLGGSLSQPRPAMGGGGSGCPHGYQQGASASSLHGRLLCARRRGSPEPRDKVWLMGPDKPHTKSPV